MDAETREMSERTPSDKRKPPLDVRIVAWCYYLVGALGVIAGILGCSGVVKPPGSSRVFLGAVVLSGGLALGIYSLFMGLCCLICDWGLTRGKRSVWWFAMALTAYHLVDYVPKFPRYPVPVAIIIAGLMSLITWLWFRRELYGVHLVARRTTE